MCPAAPPDGGHANYDQRTVTRVGMFRSSRETTVTRRSLDQDDRVLECSRVVMPVLYDSDGAQLRQLITLVKQGHLTLRVAETCPLSRRSRHTDPAHGRFELTRQTVHDAATNDDNTPHHAQAKSYRANFHTNSSPAAYR
jgi:hypothetical protein